ncbi:hypothetical protein D3C87_718640 [compost metagenome]
MRARLAALVLVLGTSLPAEALTLNRPFGSVSVDASYDDHISGRSDPEVELYPSGNADWRGSLSVGAGTDMTFDDRWGLYLGARLRGFRYQHYSDFSGVVGTGTVELFGYDLPLGVDAFLSYGYSTDGSQGQSHTTALNFEKPLGNRLTAILAGGQYWHQTSSTGLSNRGPFSDGGIRLSLPSRTNLTALISLMGRDYDYGREDRILSTSLSLSQRLWKGTYLRASYRRDQATSNEPGRTFPGNSVMLGTSYYF